MDANYALLWINMAGIRNCRQYLVSCFKNVCEIVYGIHEKVHLWSYVTEVLLWTNMAHSVNFSTVFSGSVSHIEFEESLSYCIGVDTASQMDKRARRFSSCKELIETVSSEVEGQRLTDQRR
jgi:hypothetical protein